MVPASSSSANVNDTRSVEASNFVSAGTRRVFEDVKTRVAAPSKISAAALKVAFTVSRLWQVS